MNCIDCNKPKKIVCKQRCNNCYKKYNRDKRPKIPCNCGCGTMIPPISREGKPNKFAWGHNFGKLDKNPNWKGGQFITTNGYKMIYLPNHPYCDKAGYYQEHRDVVEKHLTQLNGIRTYLHPSIEVHHINENKLDNRIENLMPVTHLEHRQIHSKINENNRSVL